MAKFKTFASAVDVHMVEVSPALKSLQWSKLGCRPSSSGSFVGSSSSSGGSSTSSIGASSSSSSSSSYRHATSSGIILPPSAQIPRSSNEHEGPGASKGVPAGNPHKEGGGLDPQSAPSCSQTQGELPAQGLSRFNGTQVTWHVSLSTVPQEQPAIYIAHEFFDALPVHQFVKDDRRGWVEKMVDTAEVPIKSSTSGQNQPEAAQQQQQQQQEQQEQKAQKEQHGQQPHSADDPPPALRFVLSPGPTPASALLVPIRTKGMDPAQADACKELEVSAHGMATAEALAVRVGRHSGAALIMDYGRDAPYGDSLMAIRDHKGVEVLDRPGSADLSTWVDFGALRQGAQESGSPVCVHGPVSQASFLTQLGIQARLEKLLQAATPAQAEQLIAGYKRLVGGSAGVVDPGSRQSGCSGSSSSSGSNEEGVQGSRKADDGSQDSGMGQSYQVMAIASKNLGGPVAGFEGGKVVEVEDSDKVLTSIHRL
ncbi:putative S-adenosyl-L-methionine-dependent methyltransferase-domain-containing protein [Dunaliella salina]|uniref:Protein arginine methyltransferase NDUFAF7 n=1 Tax=Dunaliella salina TaxID=3046 RepID=A0ABQ7GEJ9_DUNSA|nr:putative S-adenosyl-L-methionine-dependent methyltransferase-domain-containing protein [Dunaliella salina]|eukprot:KAF5833036.1 putative S-adenosyl-L-methionine-dependent methyltransferase-domain-containing protein [Dunaliella salina]